MEKIIQISAVRDGENDTIYALTNKGNLWRGYPRNLADEWKWETIDIPNYLFELQFEEE